MVSAQRHRSPLALLALAVVALASCGATFAPMGWRVVTIPSADATTIAWANGANGHPGPGIVMNPSGNVTPGTTTTAGTAGQTIRVRAPWVSIKKGVANTVGRNPCSHQASYNAINALSPTLSWFYNYSVTPWSWVTGPTGQSQAEMTDPGPNLGIPPGIQFVPMLYNVNQVTTQVLAWAQPYVTASGYIILGNEPYGETNNTTDQWIAVMPQVNALGGKIIAPSIGFNSTTAQNWLADFMTKLAANGYHVDALNFHATGGLYDGTFAAATFASQFFSGLDGMHAAYPSYPIWVTEWQMYTNTLNGPTGMEAMYDILLSGLEARSYVERYADWPLGTDPTRPINPVGADFDILSKCDANGNLTATGLLYSSYTRKY